MNRIRPSPQYLVPIDPTACQVVPLSVVSATVPFCSSANPWSGETQLAETAGEDGAFGVVVVGGVVGVDVMVPPEGTSGLMCRLVSARLMKVSVPPADTWRSPSHHDTPF